MESSALPNIASKFEADRKLRSLPGELLLLGKVRATSDPVVIKIYGSGVLNRTQEEKFKKTIELSSQLKHGNLAEIKDYEIRPEGGVVAFVTITGPFLFEFIEKTDLKNVPLRARVDFLKGLADVISYLHQKVGPLGTIHPANIIVGGRTGKAIFIDPGIGRRSSLSISGFSSLVTPYTAPEIITGGQLTVASDVFSFAALAFMFLTGHRPFSGENTISIVASMLAIEKPEICKNLNIVSKNLNDIFQNSLAENATKRASGITSFMDSVESELISREILEPSKVSVDFRKDSSDTPEPKSLTKKYSSQKLKTAAAVFAVVVILSSYVVFNLLDSGSSGLSRDDLKFNSVTAQDVVSQPTELTIDPTNFDSGLLPKLSQEELAALISNPLTNEDLGLLVLSEANNRKILLRPELFESALHSPNYRVKIGALKALEKEGQGASLSDKVLMLSSDEDPLVRGYAARTLGRVGNSSIIGGLEDWLSKEKDTQIQAVIRESIQIISKRLG